VREADVKPTVLIVDEDLGFVCSLGEILSNQGFQTIPALDSRSAMAIVEELNRQVNLVIVDPALPGVLEMTEVLSRRDRSLKIVAIADPGKAVPGAIHVHATLERPSGSGLALRQECLRSVRRALKNLGIAA